MKPNMKRTPPYSDQFGKASTKTPAEIRRACEALENSRSSDYIVKHNGNHIWLEIGARKKQFWSPLLHLELRSKDDKTFIRGEYVESPFLWVAFLLTRIVTVAVFTVSLVSIYLKVAAGEAFKAELLTMFVTISIWFAIFLLAQWNRKKASPQVAELHNLMEDIVA